LAVPGVNAERRLSEIEHVYPLIHNKVTSPHFVTLTLRRARLVDWLHQNADCRAIVIAADAGYGKTTLAWQWEREVDFPCYWYKLDRNDRDWSLHISYLIEAISQRHGDFGRRAHLMLQQLGGPGSSRPGVAAYLLAEMHERLTEPCTFIVDDWHFVASVTEVRGLWNQILRDAPPTCRFLFLSRAKPHLQFSRFKTHAGYAEMRTDTLRFTDREIDELFRDIYNDPLDASELAELERRTEGWAASLQLVEVSLRTRKTPAERRSFLQSITASKDSDLVEFLADEVLDQQPENIRQFLLTTSILHEVHPDLAARLTAMSDGEKILRDLEARGLFTYRVDPGDGRYRYHGLFRDFLQHRLVEERSPGEVSGLHIHAASFYETNGLWPEAIHHYIAAGLQPQAGRLIAKYGEDLVSDGRLALVDKWLGRLPVRTVRENARLSLLVGEASGVRGDWEPALEALQRARAFFARKGDRRMEALACSKLSTVFNNLGDVARCSEMAMEGLALAPGDAQATQLRLRGNVAVTSTWFESFAEAEQECRRIAIESDARGYEQYAAIAYHNLGVMLRFAGRLDESLASLERSARFWDASPTNPFADNSELVQTLLARGDVGRAAAVAEAAAERTRPWAKPHGEARYGMACVHAQQGDFHQAIDILRALLREQRSTLGPAVEKAISLLIECLYLSGSDEPEMRSLLVELEGISGDPRLAPTTLVASALAGHRLGACRGRCERARKTLAAWEENGARLSALVGQLPLALLAIEHDSKNGSINAANTLREAAASPVGPSLRQWFRMFTPHLSAIVNHSSAPTVLLDLIHLDPEYWAPATAPLIPSLTGEVRASVLAAIEATADATTSATLRHVDGGDVQEVRKRLIQRFARRQYIRSFGSLTVQSGGWERPGAVVGRRRMRLLLGLLVANSDTGLTRDQAIDILWPDSDPAAAVNSLNQTVFQLRRFIDAEYREAESPQYIISNVEMVRLNTDLVETDLRELRRLGNALLEPDSQAAHAETAKRLVALVRGEFLADLKYEDWVSAAQLTVHSEVRSILLPIARGEVHGVSHDAVLQAGSALTALDPYDEPAHLAIARHLASSGRRSQAREYLGRYARRLHDDLDESPSDDLRHAATLVGIEIG
jgi:ATP/maltotriose-dependent transcriptional regulator MalT/DNA-binding SARP family transcriptional activator